MAPPPKKRKAKKRPVKKKKGLLSKNGRSIEAKLNDLVEKDVTNHQGAKRTDLDKLIAKLLKEILPKEQPKEHPKEESKKG